eukprot:4655470-Prymnesium_polylepis.2
MEPSPLAKFFARRHSAGCGSEEPGESDGSRGSGRLKSVGCRPSCVSLQGTRHHQQALRPWLRSSQSVLQWGQ